MQNKWIRWIILAALGVAVSGSLAFSGEMMSVRIKQGQLRSAPTFLGKILVTLQYRDRVSVLEQKGDWLHVSAHGGKFRGWIHKSALTEKKIELASGNETVGHTATTDEIALAGKGFNRQVEEEFKARNPNIRFDAIDRMEKLQVSQSDIIRFIKQGELSPQGGES